LKIKNCNNKNLISAYEKKTKKQILKELDEAIEDANLNIFKSVKNKGEKYVNFDE